MTMTPSKPEFVAQHALEDRGRQGGRLVAGIERGDLEVRGHDRVDTGGDRGPERRGVDPVPLLAGVGDHRQSGVAVLSGVPVAREVLGAGHHAGVLIPRHLGRHHPADLAGVGAEGTDVDDGVGRVDVDVGDRGEVLVDAQGGEFGARYPSGGAGVGERAARAERHRARQLGGAAADADVRPVLLVDGDEGRDGSGQRERGPLHPVRQVRDLAGVLDVVRPAGEVDDPADVVLGDQLGHGADAEFPEVAVLVELAGRSRRRTVEVRDEQLADLRLDAHPGDDLLEAVVAPVRGRGGGRHPHGTRRARGDHGRGGENGPSGQTPVLHAGVLLPALLVKGVEGNLKDSEQRET
ncbi:hypothetical protein RKD48_001584 [Streptomyces ambofaciens]